MSALACPHCGAALTLGQARVNCGSGHVFDVARQGYVNLVSGRAAVSGDSTDMVAARADFLAGGHYAPIADAVAAVVGTAPPGLVADLGAGTGYHLAAVLDTAPGRAGLALEIAKPALRRAARAHPRLAAVGCDVWGRLPVRDGAVAVALNVFAPRNPAELARVVAPGGLLVVVSPTPAHLAGLVDALGLLTVAPDKASRITAALAPAFTLSEQDTVEFGLELSHRDVLALVGMGPSAWHVDAAALARAVAALPEPVRVTASVLVSGYRRS